MDYLHPFKPLLFRKFSIFFTFILGGPFLLPQRGVLMGKGTSVMERLCEFPHKTCVFYRVSSFSPAPDDSIRRNKRAVARQRGRGEAGYRFSGQKERTKQEVDLILIRFLKFGLMFSSGALPDRSTRWRSTTSGCAAASPPPSSPASTSTMTSVSRFTIPRAGI